MKKSTTKTIKNVILVIIVVHIIGALVFAFFDKGCNERAEEVSQTENGK